MLTTDWSKHPEVLWSEDLETALARDLSFVPQVRYVLMERAESNLLVWIGVDHPTRAVRESVYAKELSLIEGFPEVDFDFNIISSLSRDHLEVASGAKVVYVRKGGDGA